MGDPYDNFTTKHPEIWMMYQLYDLCRLKDFKVIRMPDPMKKDKGGEILKQIHWPLGLATLPGPGGIEDQRNIDISLFHAFKRGEEQGAIRSLLK